MNERVRFSKLEEIEKTRLETGKGYHEFLRVPAMSAGIYVLPAGKEDPQQPHHEDEMYYVVRGRGRFTAGGADQEVAAGSVIFVAAKVEHHFYNISEELEVVVFFAPAES
ncbi:MAG: cupin domain-containing protein [Candidatus Sulfotelmatobacter sp.]